MNTIRLYKFKDSIGRKIQLFSKESNLDPLYNHIDTNFLDIEIVTEYIITVPVDFTYEELSYKELLGLCGSAKQTIEHYFIKNINDYDMV